LSAHYAQVVHHAVDVFEPEEVGERPSLRRRVRVNLDAQPRDGEVELLLQFLDDAFADKAERSDVVGKDFDFDGHEPAPCVRFLYQG
jgi:hypothetical protein